MQLPAIFVLVSSSFALACQASTPATPRVVLAEDSGLAEVKILAKGLE